MTLFNDNNDDGNYTFRYCPIKEIYIGRNIYVKRRNDTAGPISLGYETTSIGKFVKSVTYFNPKKTPIEVINCHSMTPPEINSFTDLQYASITVNIPRGTLDAYKAHEVWGMFWNLEETLEPTTIEDDDVTPPSTGMENIMESQDATVSVYTMGGVLIKKDCRVEDLKTLAKGIYIIVSGKESYKISI